MTATQPEAVPVALAPVGVEHVAEAVRIVAQQRRALKTLTDDLAQRRDDFERDNAKLLEQVKDAGEMVDAAESACRALALDFYGRTQQAKPTAGVEIKVYEVVEVADALEALAWAKQTKLCLVPEAVDTKALLKVAKATPLPFIHYAKEPKAQIATDLEKALKP
jgi:hypothetical protein